MPFVPWNEDRSLWSRYRKGARIEEIVSEGRRYYSCAYESQTAAFSRIGANGSFLRVRKAPVEDPGELFPKVGISFPRESLFSFATSISMRMAVVFECAGLSASV